MGETVLALCGISHRFGRDVVLREVSFTARAGEVTCLLGPSGSGKSTLLRLVAGLEALQTGRISLGAEVLAEPGREPPPEARPVGLVFQDHALFPHQTAAQNIAFGLADLAPAARRAAVEKQLQGMALAGLGERYPHTLSGGQQQRVALARAMAPAPPVLLLDEPFANVDSTLRRALREDARRALRQAGAVAVVVTHDPEEALELGDRIVVLGAGAVVQAGKPMELWQAPASAAVAELFGQAQHVAGLVARGRVTTAFGDVGAVAGVEEQAVVDVVVRPMAVVLRPAANGARVEDMRYLGDGHLVFLAAGGETLRAKVADLGGLAIGDRAVATFRRDGVFVYGRQPDAPRLRLT